MDARARQRVHLLGRRALPARDDRHALHPRRVVGEAAGHPLAEAAVDLAERQGGDAFEAIKQATASGADVVIIDTAGRLGALVWVRP